METVSDPQLSPDGTQIVYTRGWVDKMNDKRESALWIMNADGSRNRFLVKGSGARWSPSGDRIAYIDAGRAEGAADLRALDGRRRRHLAGHARRTDALGASPGRPTASSSRSRCSSKSATPGRSRCRRRPPAPSGPRRRASSSSLNYRRDRSGFTDNGYRHIFVVPASGGTPRQITSGNFDHTGTDWTPDGKSILFSGLRSETTDYQWRESEIYAVDVADGDIRQLTKRKGPDGNPSVSPDGKRVAYTGYDWTTDTWVDSKIYVMNIDGSNPRLVSGDWDRAPARAAMGGRRQRALLHGAERGLAEPLLPSAQPQPARSRRSPRARRC